ncbi:DUF6531 domain-containing protein [Rhodococcus sp. ZPP]|uniref:DUF6531 domain-containing protein n=1 Tax=Rhodococcus sp. ZPP TaxID=2749906 RepID=UPI001FCD7C4E|nr:DUF6531 domain-containing protein [Rhodococcus sp. ZPP]
MLTSPFGGLHWICAFTSEREYARYSLAREQHPSACRFHTIFGWRLMDVLIPALTRPTGVVIDVAGDNPIAFPPALDEAEERTKKTAFNALSGAEQDASPLVDTWTALREEARDILRGARAERDGVAGQVSGALDAATASAPAEPPFTQRWMNNATDAMDGTHLAIANFYSGLGTGLTGIAQFVRQVNPYETYNTTHPAEYRASMSNLATGLVVAAADPGAMVSGVVSDIRKNPFEFAGSLTGDALLTAATGGAGAGVAGARTAVRLVDEAGDFGSGARLLDDVADVSHNPTPDTPHADSPAQHADTNPTSTEPAPVEHTPPRTDPAAPEPSPGPAEHADADAGANEAAREAGTDSDRTTENTCEDRDPVDIATGEFLLPEVDLTLPGVLPLVIGRRHRSGYRFGRWFGPSWSSTVDMRVVVEEAGVTLLAEDGVMLTYPHPEVGTPVMPQSGQRWTLSRTDTGAYRVHDPDRGLTWHFAPKPELDGLDSALGNLAISAITDRHRNRILFRYDASGAPVEVSHSGGYRVFINTRFGRIVGLSVVDGDTAAPVRDFEYTAGRLTAVVKPGGGSTRYRYDAEGRMLSWTDGNGNRMVNTYDEAGRVVQQKGTAGDLDSTFDYRTNPDSPGSVTVLTDSTGATTIHGFDSDLRLRDLVDAAGSRTHTDYNARREPLRVVGPDGATTSYLYTADGDVARITRPDGNVIAIDYAGPRQPVTIHHADGTMSRQEWDEQGNLVTVVDAAGARTRYEYDGSGSLTSITDAAGGRTFVDCDQAGLPEAVTDPNGAVTRITRDGFGRPTTVTDPTGMTTTYRWSADGQLVERTHPDGAVETWAYDGEGNLLVHTDAVGATTIYEYGAFDLLAARTDPDGSTTTYGWDTERRLTSVTNSLGATWSYRYDAIGRLAKETDFIGATTSYTYDAAGRVASVTPATGITRRHTYDILGNVTDVRADTGEHLHYEHDQAGRVTTAVVGTGDQAVHSLRFTYSPTGELVSETVDGNPVLRFEYDAVGRRTTRHSPSGSDTSWQWDPTGHLLGLTTDGHHLTFGHDAIGRLTDWRVGELAVRRNHTARGQLANQDVIAHPASTLNLGLAPGLEPRALRQDSYAYRPDGYLVDHTTQRDASRVVRRGFDLDPAGRITAVVQDGHAAEQYRYDPLGNITDSGSERREYLGNLLVRDGRTRFHYDAVGRLIRKTTTRLSRAPDVWHYRYNAFDQLTDVTTPDGQHWQYTYDALSRRTTKQRLDSDGTVADLTRYTWDGTHLLEQHSGGTTTRWNYQHGSYTPLTQAVTRTVDTDRLSDQRAVDNEFYAIITDLVGTPVELVDPHNADRVADATTNLWGNTTWHGAADTPLRFPGQYHDPETGLHYNLHRYYNPATARYLTQDPLGLAPSPNPNTYPHNPTGWTDPLGLVPTACEEGSDRAFDHGYDYHPRIRERGLEDPTGHNFPYSFDDQILRHEPTVQRDGSLLYRADGFLNGKPGY